MSFFVLGGCAVRLILLVSFFGVELAVAYQWRCSALDTTNNKYYLPDFGGTTQVLGYTWEQSLNGVTYVYDVNNVGCRGTVTAVEFCYTLPPSPIDNKVFTLFALTDQGNGHIRVTNSIPIHFDSRSAECSSSKCCDIMTLTEQDQFNLPSPNFFLGMTTKNSPNLAAPYFGVYPRFQTHSSYQLVVGEPMVNSILTLNSAPVQTLRLVWLHISPFSATTMSSVEQSTSSVVPKTTVSSIDDATTATDTHTLEPLRTTAARSSAPDTTISSDVTSDVTTSYSMTTDDTQRTTLTESTVSDNVSTNNTIYSSTPTSLPISTSLLTESTIPLSFINLKSGASASSSNTSVVSAVIGAVVVLVVMIITVLLVIVIFILYRRKQYHVSNNVGQRAIANIIYNKRGIKPAVAMKYPALDNPGYDRSKIELSTTACEGEVISTKQENIYYSPIVLEDNIIPHEYEDVEFKTKDIPSQQNSSGYDNICTIPANNVVGLYEQLEYMMTDDVTRHNIVLGDLLGSGQFGDVYKGVWQRRLDNLDVAVKTLKEGSSEEDKVKFLQEAAIMAQFRHPNVVTMYGVVRDKEPILLVLEMLKNGDLRNYLLSMKTDDGKVSSEIDSHELVNYCRHVASGMVYLSNKAFVHRNLAARNILMSDDRICKIADFGMSRDLVDQNYYVSNGGKVPVKWTAPEALFYKKYSTASDVWSFGAVMYEIWSIGCKPFQNMQNAQVIKKINSGYRLPPPPGCPRAIYSIMMSCWHPDPNKRPSFNEISTKLSVSNSIILHKDETDIPSAATLGADLSHGEGLYENLQKMYNS